MKHLGGCQLEGLGAVGFPPETADAATGQDPGEERIARIVLGDISQGNRHQQQVRVARAEAYKLFKGEPLGNEVEGRSHMVSRDVLDTVESIMPSLMEIFAGGNEVATCSPVGREDEHTAELLTRVLNYQFLTLMGGFVLLYSWIKDSLVYGVGVIKLTWKRESTFLEDAIPTPMTGEQLEVLRSMPGIEVVTAEPVQPPTPLLGVPVPMQYQNVVLRRETVLRASPDAEVVDPADFGYDPTATDLDGAKFVYHRTRRTLSELLDLQDRGVYRNVDRVRDALSGAGGGSAWSNADDPMSGSAAEKDDRFAADGLTSPARFGETSGEQEHLGRREVDVYEWWGLLDRENEGRLVPYLVAIAAGVVIRCEENPFGHKEHPFVMLRPILDPHRMEGLGYGDLCGEFQKTKTSILRQFLDNLSFVNNAMTVVDRNANVEMKSLLNPRPGGVVRTDRMDGVRREAIQPLSGPAIQALEFVQTLQESRTGVTRYNQGMDSRSLNKTATGLSAIMGASVQRLKLIARLMAETGIRGVFRKMVALNQQFSDPGFVMRIHGEPLTIAPDDIDGRFDVTVDVGVSAGKEEMVQTQMLQLLQLSPMLVQAGVMVPENLRNVVSRLLSSWGYKDPEPFLSPPGDPGMGAAVGVPQQAASPGLNLPQLAADREMQRQRGGAALGHLGG